MLRFLTDGAIGIPFSDDGVIAGCVLPCDRISAIGEIGSLLEGRGWRTVPSGQEAVLTSLKKKGSSAG